MRWQKRFYTRGTLKNIRVSRSAKIPILYRDWLRSLNEEKGLIISVEKNEGRFERHSLEWTKCRSICWSIIKYLLRWQHKMCEKCHISANANIFSYISLFILIDQSHLLPFFCPFLFSFSPSFSWRCRVRKRTRSTIAYSFLKLVYTVLFTPQKSVKLKNLKT